MSEIIKRIDELFCFVKGTNDYNSSIINENPGDIPVYSGQLQNDGIIGYTNNVQYSGEFIRVITVGNAGQTNVISGDFCLAQNNGILKFIKEENEISLDYVSLVLNKLLPPLAKGDKQKSLIWKDFKSLKISIPALSPTTYNLEKQRELAIKYQEIEKRKKILLDKIDFLKKSKIIINKNEDIEYKSVPLNKIVKHHNGKSSYTKEWCQQNKGNIPLYSANNNKPFAMMNKADYEGKHLTYSKNGCAGYITIIDGKFSVNGDRCVMSINTEYQDKICLEYLKYYLEPIFRANIKGRMGIDGKNEYTKINSTIIEGLNIQIPIPYINGQYDLEKQKEIAQKYIRIEFIKKEIEEKIIELTNIVVV